MDRVSSRKVRTALRSAPRSFGAKFNFVAAGASGPRSTVWSQNIAYGYFTLGLRPVSVWNVTLEVSPLLNSHHVSQIRINKSIPTGYLPVKTVKKWLYGCMQADNRNPMADHESNEVVGGANAVGLLAMVSWDD